jgi:hypothetical protein
MAGLPRRHPAESSGQSRWRFAGFFSGKKFRFEFKKLTNPCTGFAVTQGKNE